jgi:hypothetical protein
MKIKVLSCLKKTLWYCNEVGQEFEVTYDINNCHSNTQFRCIKDKKLFFNIEDIVITELPTLFCVENYRDINKEKWLKYIWWLNQNYNANSDGSLLSYYGINNENKAVILSNSIGIEMHIDDIIKHIDYMEDINKNKINEMSEEFDMSTNEGRLAYAIKYYPIGTKYVPLDYKTGDTYPQSIVSRFEPQIIVSRLEPQITTNPYANCYSDIDSGNGFIYVDKFNKWAEIIKEEDRMKTQKLSRKGLKEIHSVACTRWKEALEHYGTRNPLEDYIELSEQEVETMFKECTKEQLPIVSKYLKQDDGSIDLTNIKNDRSGFILNKQYIIRQDVIEYDKKSFWLNNDLNWEIKIVNNLPRLYPTKKK